MKKYIFWCFCALAVTACDKEKIMTEIPEGHKIFQETYISTYVDIDQFQIKQLHGSTLYPAAIGRQCMRDNDNDRERFWEFARKYGDTDFNDYGLPRMACGQAIRFIEVTCSSAFDAEHPAGSSLRDIVKINASSDYLFVHNGYDPAYLNHMISKLLSSMTEVDGYMLYPAWRLYFPTNPSAPGKYEIKVDITLDDGKIFSSVTTMTF